MIDLDVLESEDAAEEQRLSEKGFRVHSCASARRWLREVTRGQGALSGGLLPVVEHGGIWMLWDAEYNYLVSYCPYCGQMLYGEGPEGPGLQGEQGPQALEFSGRCFQ